MNTATDTSYDNSRRFTERAGERVRDIAHRGMSSVSDGAHAAQRHISEYAHASGRYVAEHPMKSALIAAAIGAAVAGLVMALRRNRRSDYF